jgi:hypothetical protein
MKIKALLIILTVVLSLALSCSSEKETEIEPEIETPEEDEPVALTDIEVQPSVIEGFIDETVTLTATLVPENASDSLITWKSADKTIAIVSKTGEVTIVSSGNTNIEVSCGEVKKTVPVTGLSSLLISRNAPFTSYIAGDTLHLKSNALSASWSSSNTAIATVSDEGVVTFTGSGWVDISVTLGKETKKLQFFCVGGTKSDNGALRFAVLSDTHFGKGDAIAKVTQSLRTIMAKTPLVDAIVDVGDITDSGTAGQYVHQSQVFNDNSIVPQKVAKYYLMGNHDNFSSDGQAQYRSNTGQPLHQYFSIKGYPFITISQTGTGAQNFDDAARSHLMSSLSDARLRFKGKPIFVFMHVPPLNTCYGSRSNDGWGTSIFSSIFEQYPEIIIFSGHSHFPLGDPRSIWQEKYTAVNDGSTTYSELEPNVVSEGIHPTGYSNVTEAVIVNILANGDVEMERWDTYRDEEILPRWTVKAPHDGSNFTYRNRDGKPGPSFAAGAKPTVTVNGAECTVKFPQATDNEVVHNYKIELVTDNGTVLSSYKKFSQFYLNSKMPTELSVSLNLVASSAKLQAQVTAYDSYNNASSTISSDYVSVSVEPVAPPSPAAQWLFDDAANLAKATIGSPLQFVGSGITAVAGPSATNGAALVDAASYIKAVHGIAANGGGSKVNEYTMQYDFSVPQISKYNSFYQTNWSDPTADDGELFINASGGIGVESAYYGKVVADRWHRLIVSVKVEARNYYLDGVLISSRSGNSIDSRFALETAGVLFFADNDGERLPFKIANITMWSKALSAQEVAYIGLIGD